MHLKALYRCLPFLYLSEHYEAVIYFKGIKDDVKLREDTGNYPENIAQG